MSDYLEQGHTINGTYYADELRQLRGKLTQGVLFLHDHALAHTSQAAMAAATDCDFEILSHPQYSPFFGPL
jgi:hypothetical protein